MSVSHRVCKAAIWILWFSIQERRDSTSTWDKFFLSKAKSNASPDLTYIWFLGGLRSFGSCWSSRDLRRGCNTFGDMVVNTVHWFRKGLRLHDNPSLRDSIKGADNLRCVYILDPWFAGSSNVGISRWRWVCFLSGARVRPEGIRHYLWLESCLYLGLLCFISLVNKVIGALVAASGLTSAMQ